MTDFVGLDLSGDMRYPMFWATLLRGSDGQDRTWRRLTEAEALEGHHEIVAQVVAAMEGRVLHEA